MASTRYCNRSEKPHHRQWRANYRKFHSALRQLLIDLNSISLEKLRIFNVFVGDYACTSAE